MLRQHNGHGRDKNNFKQIANKKERERKKRIDAREKDRDKTIDSKIHAKLDREGATNKDI